MTPDSAERLMQFLDGELGEAESREIEALLAESAEARAFISDLEEVGSNVRSIGLDRALPLSDLTEPIMSRIARDGAPAESPRGSPGSVVRMARYWAPAAALAMAAAAAWLVYLRPVQVPPRASSRATSTAEAPVAAPSMVGVTEPAESDEETGAEIESVDFGAHNGTIFMVASGPQLTPVVWLMDENAPGSGRMKPL